MLEMLLPQHRVFLMSIFRGIKCKEKLYLLPGFLWPSSRHHELKPLERKKRLKSQSFRRVSISCIQVSSPNIKNSMHSYLHGGQWPGTHAHTALCHHWNFRTKIQSCSSLLSPDVQTSSGNNPRWRGNTVQAARVREELSLRTQGKSQAVLPLECHFPALVYVPLSSIICFPILNIRKEIFKLFYHSRKDTCENTCNSSLCLMSQVGTATHDADDLAPWIQVTNRSLLILRGDGAWSHYSLIY